jgi:hypothetical protein
MCYVLQKWRRNASNRSMVVTMFDSSWAGKPKQIIMEKILLLCALALLVCACCFIVKNEYGFSLASFVLAALILERVSRNGKQIK